MLATKTELELKTMPKIELTETEKNLLKMSIMVIEKLRDGASNNYKLFYAYQDVLWHLKESIK